MDTWILGMARARGLRQVVAWVLACAVALGIAWSQQRYIANFVAGPYVADRAVLDSVTDVETAPRYFVRVTGSKAIDTGMQEITVHTRNGRETSRDVSAAYYALALDDRFLIAKSHAGAQTTMTGALLPLPSDFEGQMFNTPEMKSVRPRFYSYYLDDESFRLPGYIAIGVTLVFLLLLFSFARPAWRHFSDPASHPAAQRAAAWGDPIGTAVAAERESRAARFTGGGWRLTEQFLIRASFFSFDLLRLSDLLWAYKKVTKHSVNFIPTGKTYEAVLACRGGTASIGGNEKTVDAMLAFVGRRTPWAVFGFSPELETAFTKDAAGFVAAVEARHRDYLQQLRAQKAEKAAAGLSDPAAGGTPR